MRILILTQYIYPEIFRSSEMAFELAKRGHTVHVLTGIPNYPAGRYFKGYGVFKKRVEVFSGVKFYRCFQTPRKLLPSVFGLALNYLSFVISASLWVLFFFAFKKRYDVIITHEPSPITQILPAILLKKLKGTPVLSWIMDIWPDSVTDSLSNKYRKYIIPPLNKITNYIYKNSDLLLITSRGFEQMINRDFDYSKKIVYFPNWSHDFSIDDSESQIPQLPDGFIIMVAGNLGNAQNLEAVADTIIQLKDIPEVKWVFVGDGSKRSWLEAFVKDNNLSGTVFIMGQYPVDTMPKFFQRANAMLVTLMHGHEFLNVTVPARLQSYMSASRPILGMLGSGGAQIIRESACGYCVDPGDSTGLAMIIKDKVLSNRSDFEEMGKNGRRYFEQYYMIDLCIDNLLKIIDSQINRNNTF